MHLGIPIFLLVMLWFFAELCCILLEITSSHVIWFFNEIAWLFLVKYDGIHKDICVVYCHTLYGKACVLRNLCRCPHFKCPE